MYSPTENSPNSPNSPTVTAEATPRETRGARHEMDASYVAVKLSVGKLPVGFLNLSDQLGHGATYGHLTFSTNHIR